MKLSEELRVLADRRGSLANQSRDDIRQAADLLDKYEGALEAIEAFCSDSQNSTAMAMAAVARAALNHT